MNNRNIQSLRQAPNLKKGAMEFFLRTFYDYLWNAENFNVQNLTKNLGEKQSCQNKALKTVAKNMNEKITQK